MTDAPMHCGQPMMGLEWWGKYDGVLVWWCPSCEHWKHRFESGPLREKAWRAVGMGFPDPKCEIPNMTDTERDTAYRTAAARLSGGRVHPMATVNQPASMDGAFIEVTVWVPQAEMEKER